MSLAAMGVLSGVGTVGPYRAGRIPAENKIDLLDPGAGESIVGVLDGCARQLRRIGFSNPLLIPVAGDLALRLRQVVKSAIPYTMGDGKPQLAKSKREGVFEAVGSPRMLARVRRSIEVLLSAKKFYRTGLRFSEEGSIALTKVDHMRQYWCGGMKSLWLAGRLFTGAELRSAMKMTGLPVVEHILEAEINRFSAEGGLK